MTTTKAMKDIVQQNAHGASQLADSAQSLSDQVERLHQQLSRFKLEAQTSEKSATALQSNA